jgi:hypothetical protein
MTYKGVCPVREIQKMSQKSAGYHYKWDKRHRLRVGHGADLTAQNDECGAVLTSTEDCTDLTTQNRVRETIENVL